MQIPCKTGQLRQNVLSVTDHPYIVSRMGTRCFWDSGSDNSASETFMNVSFNNRVSSFVSDARVVFSSSREHTSM